MSLIERSSSGLYCPRGDFHIDPWKPVSRAVVTHAHSDHARRGMRHYLAHHDSLPVMRYRLGADISIEGLRYGEKRYINGVEVSLHPAGHVIGSAQVRVAYKGEVWVISGDYKLGPDRSCVSFEPIPCEHFVTESTFGLPVYHWRSDAAVFDEVNSWWNEGVRLGEPSIIFAYAFGKAQRILASVDTSIGPVFTHGAVENTNEVLRDHGIPLPATQRITPAHHKADFKGSLIIAPPSAQGTPWMRRLGKPRTASASGWMMLRGTRRRRNVDRGFVISDHADWQGLNTAVAATGATHVYVTHGYSGIFSKWLSEQGYHAQVLETAFSNDGGETEPDA